MAVSYTHLDVYKRQLSKRRNRRHPGGPGKSQRKWGIYFWCGQCSGLFYFPHFACSCLYPVSYTHLIMRCLKMNCRKKATALRVIQTPKYCSTLLKTFKPTTIATWRKPVSYTHLDVYKRQIYDYGIYWNLVGLTVFLSLIGIVPVSYTHLDVYKRQGLARAIHIAYPAAVQECHLYRHPLYPANAQIHALRCCACLLYTSRCV